MAKTTKKKRAVEEKEEERERVVAVGLANKRHSSGPPASQCCRHSHGRSRRESVSYDDGASRSCPLVINDWRFLVGSLRSACRFWSLMTDCWSCRAFQTSIVRQLVESSRSAGVVRSLGYCSSRWRWSSTSSPPVQLETSTTQSRERIGIICRHCRW